MKEKILTLTGLAKDTLEGLTSEPKYLLPKYFYDDRGSMIFGKIMQMPEYYLTDCEIEIFREQKDEMATLLIEKGVAHDIIELGPGDGVKTGYLLKHLADRSLPFRYIPVDISSKSINELVNRMQLLIPGINVQAETGDFFSLIRKINQITGKQKIIVFLGSSIGNFSDTELDDFFSKLSDIMNVNDKILIGFDLKKSASVIKKAYDDPYGLTSEFNLNHLYRINRELDADFNLHSFIHRQEYDPLRGEMKSYLTSMADQEVNIAGLDITVSFRKGESIFMELSRKFDIERVHNLASTYDFIILKNFTDSRDYFLDSLWKKV